MATTSTRIPTELLPQVKPKKPDQPERSLLNEETIILAICIFFLLIAFALIARYVF